MHTFISIADYAAIRDAVDRLCARFTGEHWRKLNCEMAYPSVFVNALTEAGWLAGLIPVEYGSAGLPRKGAVTKEILLQLVSPQLLWCRRNRLFDMKRLCRSLSA